MSAQDAAPRARRARAALGASRSKSGRIERIFVKNERESVHLASENDEDASLCTATECGSAPLFDMHCHLGFADNALELAAAFASRGGGALSATVEPSEYLRMRVAMAGEPAVQVGLGLHPWWLDDGRCGEEEVAACVELAREARFIAETGLDFAPRRTSSRDLQLDAFTRICAVAGRMGGKVLSVHAVSAAHEALDVMERCGVLVEGGKPCEVILHWYSGPSDQLQRAVRLGCFFSVGFRMLQTKRGREYARVLPADRLLLETDLPPSADGAFDPNALLDALSDTLEALERIRGESLGDRIAENSRALLGVVDGAR